MTTPDKILVDLLTEQSTSDALAERMRIPMLAVRAMCDRHHRDGLVEQTKIYDSVPLWRLTDSGRAAAATLSPPVAASA